MERAQRLKSRVWKAPLLIMTMMLICLAFSFDTQAKPVTLIVTVVDGVSIRQRYVDVIANHIQSILPDHRVIQITESTEKQYSERMPFLVARRLQKKIETIALDPTDIITEIILVDHGTTIESTALNPSATSFEHLGNVSSAGPDLIFKSIFSSLQGRTADGLKIVMNSCSTMCGTDAETSARAQAMLDFFHARNGIVYGAITPEAHLAGSIPSNFRIEDWLPGRELHLQSLPAFLLYVGIRTILLHNGAFSTLGGSEILNTLNVAAAAFIYSVLRDPAEGRIITLLGRLNQGKIFISKNGVIDKIIPVRSIKEKFKIFTMNQSENLTCKKEFADY